MDSLQIPISPVRLSQSSLLQQLPEPFHPTLHLQRPPSSRDVGEEGRGEQHRTPREQRWVDEGRREQVEGGLEMVHIETRCDEAKKEGSEREGDGGEGGEEVEQSMRGAREEEQRVVGMRLASLPTQMRDGFGCGEERCWGGTEMGEETVSHPHEEGGVEETEEKNNNTEDGGGGEG